VLGILLVGNHNEQSDGLVGESDVVGVQALNQEDLPAVETLPIELDQLVQAADAEVLHVVIAVVEELVYRLH
jgi:hypothetical protein